MIVNKSITGLAVVALSSAGEEGTAWLHEDDTGAVGQVDVRVYHTNAGMPSIATVRLSGKKLYKSNANDDMMLIGADDSLDIYYAVCANDGDEATVKVDVS